MLGEECPFLRSLPFLEVSISEYKRIYKIEKSKIKTVNLIKGRISMIPIGLNTAVDLDSRPEFVQS